MSRTNEDAVTGEFSAHKPRSEPLESSGHQPGKLVGNDALPTFHAQTLPAGTAPPESTFKPNSDNETIAQETVTKASDTIGGATSADVHTGYGHPGSGQSSKEQHDNTSSKSGLAGRVNDASDPSSADQ